MQLINEYNVFRQGCFDFQQNFIETYLPEGQLYCHPYIKGLILIPCNEEEAKSNDLSICRLYDLMLYSEDGETDWKPFVKADVQEKASINEHVFISDLLFRTKFLAHDWMVDGKHDQVIINEEHMRKNNIPYAPVIPLTNQRVKLKKVFNNLLWKQGTPDNPAVITFEDIQAVLDDHMNLKLENFPVISEINSMKLPIGDSSVDVSVNGARYFKIEKGLENVSTLKAQLDEVSRLIEATGAMMTLSGYTIKYMLSALKKNGIDMKPIDFRKDYYNPLVEKLPETHTPEEEVECAKKAFINAIVEKNTCGFTKSETGREKYDSKLKEIETAEISGGEIVEAIAELLSEKPADTAVFRMLRANCSAESDIDFIEDFWFDDNIKPFDDEQLDARIRKVYIPADAVDADGKFVCSIAKATDISEEIASVTAKYKYKSCKVLGEISAYVEEESKKTRTYNGTVFASVEEMNLAKKTEIEFAEKCEDVSALNAEELKKLKKFIYESTADKKTKGKYLLKVKIAENSVQENELKQKTIGVSAMDSDKAAALLEELKNSDYDKTILKPFIAEVEDRVTAAQAGDLEKKFADIDKKSADELAKLSDELKNGKYPEILTKLYGRKLERAKNELARKDLSSMCENMEGLSKDKLAQLKKDVEAKGYSKFITAGFTKKISFMIDDFDRKEVRTVFGSIKTASKEELNKLREIINEGKYASELTDPYISQISERETAIGLEDFTARCDKIDTMNKTELEDIKKELTSGAYPSDITAKYSEKLKAREVVLEKEEIAKLCEGLEKLSLADVEKLEKTLSDEKYNSEYTAPYFDKIAKRKDDIQKEEIAELLKDLDKKTKDDIIKIKDKLANANYKDEYKSECIEKLSEREVAIDKEEIAELCKDIDKLDLKGIDELTAKLNTSRYNKNYTVEYFEKLQKRKLAVINHEADELVSDLGKKNKSDLKTIAEKLSSDRFDKEYTKPLFEKIREREMELDKAELTAKCNNIDKLEKEALEKLSEEIKEKYSPEVYKPFIDKIESREIEIMKKELDKLCKGIPSMPRHELAKLKEALKTDVYDKDVSAKYISQIEQREEALIKTELENLCKNIDTLAVDKLRELKKKITSTPEYEGKIKLYTDKIDARLKKLEKEEFDKQFNAIDKMNLEDLEKFRDDLEKRKAALDASLYIDTAHRIDVRFDAIEKEELEKLCGDITKLTVAQITDIINTIEDKGFEPKNSSAYIKKLNDAATNIHIKTLNDLTENIGTMNKQQLGEVISKIRAYGDGCPEDLKSRCINKVQSRIREVEDSEVQGMLRGLNAMSMNETLALMDKIQAMDIDMETKKRHIGTCERHIIYDRTTLRDKFAEKLIKDMGEIGVNDAHLTSPNSKVFESYYTAMRSSFIKTGPYDVPLVLHEAGLNQSDVGFAVTLDYVFVCDKNGLVTKKKIDEVRSFEGSKGLFGGALKMIDIKDVKTDMPNNGFKGSKHENVARVLNNLLETMHAEYAAERMKEREEAAQRLNSIPAAPTPAPVKPAAPAPAPVPTAPAKPAAPSPVPVKTPAAAEAMDEIKHLKPLEPVEIKDIKPIESKPEKAPELPKVPEIKPLEKVEKVDIKPLEKVETPSEKPLPQLKPVSVDLDVDVKEEVKAVEKKPEAPAEKPKEAAPAPAAAKPIKMKFCDQCGAKLTSDTAKFCSECGNRISR